MQANTKTTTMSGQEAEQQQQICGDRVIHLKNIQAVRDLRIEFFNLKGISRTDKEVLVYLNSCLKHLVF